MRLLVTRPEPDATPLAQELQNLGHEALLQPLLEFESVDFDPSQISGIDALIITSRNGVRALQEKSVLPAISHLPVFCVGKATADLARSAGFETVGGAACTAKDLVPKIVSVMRKGAQVAHVTGEHRAFDLASALCRRDFEVRSITAYTMRARTTFDAWLMDAFHASRVDGVILMSPRTAEIFICLCRRADLLTKIKTLDYFCLAESVSAKLGDIERKRILIAARPSREALVEMISVAPG